MSQSITFGIAYNLWDDTIEHIEPIVRRIRPYIHFIAVIWQNHSYHGAPSTKPLETICESLKQQGLIDHHECFVPKKYLFFNGHRNEVAKRNQGLQLSKARGITYHMSADADEYFLENDIRYILNTYCEEDLDAAACASANYYKSFDFVAVDLSEIPTYVPLFYRVNKNLTYGIPCSNRTYLHVLTDPTKIAGPINTKCKVFKPTEVLCHHGAVVRRDLETKWLSYSSGWRFGSSTIYRFLKDFADFDVKRALETTTIGSHLPERKWIWNRQYLIVRVENVIEQPERKDTPPFTTFIVDFYLLKA